MTATASMPFPREPANYDEVSMQQSMLFSDSLKDLKNLRKQLYSAAEYFELSYTNDDQKHIVVNTLKDYAIKALVNTVDHLGSVTYKVNDLLDEKVDEVSGTELRVSCIEQRLRTCQEYIDREGISQQSLVINTPNYHKRYILPVGETMHGAVRTKSKYQGCSLDDGDEWHQFKNEVTNHGDINLNNICSKGRSPSPSPKLAQQPGNFSFSGNIMRKDLERRTVSPHRFPLLRSGSLSSKPTTPKVQILAPQIEAGQPPQTRLLEGNRIFLNLESQLQCGFALRKKVPKTAVNNTPAKVNVCSKLCSVDASQRKMICCILIWMNTDGNQGGVERRAAGKVPFRPPLPTLFVFLSGDSLKELYHFVFPFRPQFHIPF
ncbi:UNVERIFIED_CONTAM: protein ABIL3 [Sesamum latifolium]|uniref:Protein ABIL3 n=1 Tax=Sesamum latifolium TaxID=2727402 RepID=A0AAW2TA62_9LAMI